MLEEDKDQDFYTVKNCHDFLNLNGKRTLLKLFSINPFTNTLNQKSGDLSAKQVAANPIGNKKQSSLLCPKGTMTDRDGAGFKPPAFWSLDNLLHLLRCSCPIYNMVIAQTKPSDAFHHLLPLVGGRHGERLKVFGWLMTPCQEVHLDGADHQIRAGRRKEEE